MLVRDQLLCTQGEWYCVHNAYLTVYLNYFCRSQNMHFFFSLPDTIMTPFHIFTKTKAGGLIVLKSSQLLQEFLWDGEVWLCSGWQSKRLSNGGGSCNKKIHHIFLFQIMTSYLVDHINVSRNLAFNLCQTPKCLLFIVFWRVSLTSRHHIQ